ncbi:Secondary metabolism regulator LAE1 [Colletotrichum gloeosporioides]|uniref:Secondary metabolism regulator LAE1 n=1 Tax=Colletotrichum gloeosporioides TaxID=474922 RepID=A0A8H4FRH2_COLGL|nr:Secondary metabolism regulator LAE1 [Colletotrichum gloeosporioides]KAF3811893.1 Secondary metabolism regulator LAE1 [Colletotrichum gloeosporioides]
MADSSKAQRSPTGSPPAEKTTSPERSKTASPKSKTASPAAPGSPEAVAPQVDNNIEVDNTTGDAAIVTDDQFFTLWSEVDVLDRHTLHLLLRVFLTIQRSMVDDTMRFAPERELDRLDFLSALIVKTVGKLYYAPLEPEKTNRILDIGTGTGIWAIEVAEFFPNAEIIGNDLSATQETWVPPNVKFEVDDVESPWVRRSYDYIFCRSMAGAIADWPKLVNNIFANTNPGGWAEFEDWDLLYRSDDGSYNEKHQTHKMLNMFFDACKIIGREARPGPLIPQWLEDAGFVNIVHHRYPIPVGPWARDPHYKDIGMMNLHQVLDGLEAFNLRLFTGVLGWTEAEVQVLLAQCRKELKTGAFHAYINLAEQATADAASPKSWTLPSRSKTASPTVPGSTPEGHAARDEGGDTGAQQTPIEVDEQVCLALSRTLMPFLKARILDFNMRSLCRSVSAYTKSLSSSVVDYPTEHGRRYHAFRHGAYYGPNDEAELDRLDFLSDFLIKVMEGKLYHAPIDSNRVHRILDIGTGTGIWAVQIADEFPNAEVIGNDLSPVQMEWVPPNVKFEVDDVESPWIGPKYDFIFSRTMAGAIADWPQLAKNVFENTNPGGWAEFQDWDIVYYCDDGTLTEDTYTMKMDRMFLEACQMIGRDPCPGPQLEGWLKDAGFVNIRHKMFKIPIGTWPKDARLKDLGHMNVIQIMDGLEAYNMRLFTSVLGWTQVEAQVLFAEVRKEMMSNRYHGYTQFHVAYGQVPEAEAE